MGYIRAMWVTPNRVGDPIRLSLRQGTTPTKTTISSGCVLILIPNERITGYISIGGLLRFASSLAHMRSRFYIDFLIKLGSDQMFIIREIRLELLVRLAIKPYRPSWLIIR